MELNTVSIPKTITIPVDTWERLGDARQRPTETYVCVRHTDGEYGYAWSPDGHMAHNYDSYEELTDNH
jgi:hypothetical protein